ncbi:hypothetical protein N7478_006540 [Penicillium angulare]|uniref:uncharacterized protein n=1 Tax=Penicillium angulare TaxID=116970 RepID=UPI00253F8F09|nr:uncharacterized protein N7478_006540 [Penicillium angulare]KAJ5281168.1 hypothetical protein N7478_006540 [Penicillium angulare]
MPRSSAAGRKNQNNRQENGPVGPGKKVIKQKSSSHLNGSPPNGSVPAGTAAPVDLSAHRSTSDTAVTSPVVAKGTDGSKADGNGRGMANGHNGKAVDMACGQVNGVVPHNGGMAGVASRNGTAKRSGSNASINPLQLASTILKSCPMYDTIAILIFLLQLPPMVLTLVQFLFASLTFMPPSGAVAGSLSANFDIFQGPAGTPSLGTMMAMDTFCLLVWGLFMWTWAQNFAIDLAHVQVAITLGGGGSGKNGGVNGLCVGIVLLLHIVRSKGIQDFVLGHLVSAKLVSPDILSQFSNLLPAEFRRTEASTSPSWLRSLLAVHILAQAGTAMARRSMAKNRAPPPSRSGKRGDTEASAGSQNQPDSALESAASLSSSLMGPDGQFLKDGKDRLTSAKKRRRQANQVRSRQPFWAALASTKVTVMREYEHSRASSKTTRGLTMTEEDLQGVSLDDGLVWVTDVDSSSIKFAAGDLNDDSLGSGSYEAGRLEGDMEPFYVYVNGALWATATILRVSDSSKGPSMVQWRGEISGLAPNCAYTCSFMRSDTDEEICAMSVKTPATADTEQAVSVVSTPSHPPYRPSSPTTTLKNSIVNAESKLNDKRYRLKKTKNDHKLLISKVRREVDNYNNRLQSGTDENKQKQRSLQLERNIRQTEEATAALEQQLDTMENVPEEEVERWNAHKADFDRELERFNLAKEELQEARLAAAQQASAVEQELNMVIQKRERLQGRRTRVNEQYDRIISANAQGLNERERRAAEQFAREQDQSKMEANFHEQFASISQSVQDFQLRTSQLWQQASAIEQSIQQQQQQMLLDSGPLTPEGNLPGTNPLPETSTAPTHSRSLLALSFPPARSSPLHISSSPEHATSSHPASPVQDAFTSQFPSSPFGNGNSYFVSDTNPRDRSFSNRSAHSSLYGSEFFEPNRMPLQVDLSDLLSEKPRSGSDSNGFLFQNGRPMLSPFQRATSRGSGAGSGSGSGGSGSGSGSGSPKSARD